MRASRNAPMGSSNRADQERIRKPFREQEGSRSRLAGEDVSFELTANTSIEEFVVKSLKIFVTLAVLAAACASGSADAGHVRVFVGVGAPFFYPFAPLPYYYPPVVSVPATPVNYVEQGQPSAGPGRPSGSWYYCNGSRAYYPYVKQCPGGWREVSPQPASSR